jgi:hypothetical protein
MSARNDLGLIAGLLTVELDVKTRQFTEITAMETINVEEAKIKESILMFIQADLVRLHKIHTEAVMAVARCEKEPA